jgi:UDP-N-acetylglucosamine 1-carboxyvinyltransferase
MTKIVVHGGRRLTGRVPVSGSKNAGLPLLFASLLTRERCTIRGCHAVADITTTLRLLEKSVSRSATTLRGDSSSRPRSHVERGALRAREDDARDRS